MTLDEMSPETKQHIERLAVLLAERIVNSAVAMSVIIQGQVENNMESIQNTASIISYAASSKAVNADKESRTCCEAASN